MTRILRSLLALALLAGPALADKVTSVVLTTAVNSISVPTDGYQVATVTISAASGSPDGTAIIYVDGKSMGTGGTYATPTAVKVFRGPVAGNLRVVLAGNSTGTVNVELRLK